MTTAVLSLNKAQKNIQTKIDSMDIPVINWKAACLMGFIASMILLVFYVWQINNLTKGSYLINNYENQISKLSDENQNLEVSFAESSFMGQALTKIEALNFQKADSIKYVPNLDDSAKTTPEDKNI